MNSDEITDLGDAKIRWLNGICADGTIVNSIKRIWVHGEMSRVPWFELELADGTIKRLNGKQVESIEYAVETPC